MEITYFFMGLVLFIEILHYKERKDLYNRLMAKNMNEYTVHETEMKKPKVKATPEPEFYPV